MILRFNSEPKVVSNIFRPFMKLSKIQPCLSIGELHGFQQILFIWIILHLEFIPTWSDYPYKLHSPPKPSRIGRSSYPKAHSTQICLTSASTCQPRKDCSHIMIKAVHKSFSKNISSLRSRPLVVHEFFLEERSDADRAGPLPPAEIAEQKTVLVHPAPHSSTRSSYLKWFRARFFFWSLENNQWCSGAILFTVVNGHHPCKFSTTTFHYQHLYIFGNVWTPWDSICRQTTNIHGSWLQSKAFWVEPDFWISSFHCFSAHNWFRILILKVILLPDFRFELSVNDAPVLYCGECTAFMQFVNHNLPLPKPVYFFAMYRPPETVYGSRRQTFFVPGPIEAILHCS